MSCSDGGRDLQGVTAVGWTAVDVLTGSSDKTTNRDRKRCRTVGTLVHQHRPECPRHRRAQIKGGRQVEVSEWAEEGQVAYRVETHHPGGDLLSCHLHGRCRNTSNHVGHRGDETIGHHEPRPHLGRATVQASDL